MVPLSNVVQKKIVYRFFIFKKYNMVIAWKINTPGAADLLVFFGPYSKWFDSG